MKQSFTMSLGKAVIPAAIKFFKTIDDGLGTLGLLANWDKKLAEVSAAHGAEVASTAKSYKEYYAEQMRVAKTTGALKENTLSLAATFSPAIAALEQASSHTVEYEGKTYLLANSFKVLTYEQMKATQGAYGYNGALDESKNRLGALQSYEEDHAAAAARTADATKSAQAATVEYNKALGEYITFVSDAKLKQLDLGETLLNAKPADIATQAIGALKDQMRDGTNAGIDYAGLIEQIQLKNGLASKSSIAMAEGLAILNSSLADGTLAPEQYAAALGKIPKAAADGIISAKELGVSVVGDFKDKLDRMDAEGNAAIVKTTVAPLQKVRDAGAAAVAQWSLVDATIKKIPLEITTNYHLITHYSSTGTPPVVPIDNGNDVGQSSSSGTSGGSSTPQVSNRTVNLNLHVSQPMNNVISEFGALRALAGEF